MKTRLVTLAALFLCLTAVSFSQHEQQVSETESTVPELSSFHKVVYPLWHKAYPDKDYELFKKLLPDINSGVEKIYSSKLPGILRDKQGEWESGLDKLRMSVENFNKAIEENNEAEILSSAEALHSNYEMLVRIIRPVTKEVDEFHKVLYMIYHHYLPEKQSVELSAAIDDLMMRADTVQNSTLPKWAAKKQEAFTKLADELFISVKELHSVKDSEFTVIEKAVNKVHSKYQQLEALFD